MPTFAAELVRYVLNLRAKLHAFFEINKYKEFYYILLSIWELEVYDWCSKNQNNAIYSVVSPLSTTKEKASEILKLFSFYLSPTRLRYE